MKVNYELLLAFRFLIVYNVLLRTTGVWIVYLGRWALWILWWVQGVKLIRDLITLMLHLLILTPRCKFLCFLVLRYLVWCSLIIIILAHCLRQRHHLWLNQGLHRLRVIQLVISMNAVTLHNLVPSIITLHIVFSLTSLSMCSLSISLQ